MNPQPEQDNPSENRELRDIKQYIFWQLLIHMGRILTRDKPTQIQLNFTGLSKIEG